MSSKKYYPVYTPYFDNKEIEYVTDCVSSGWISSLGIYTAKFSKAFAKYIGSRYALPLSSGTAAIHLALLALGIGKGDEVIVPNFTFIATANPVTYTGAKPVFVDVIYETAAINYDLIEEKITPKTKAIIVAHLYGIPAHLGKIKKITDKYNLHLIEDAAESHGATYRTKKLGSIGDVGCFSFYGNKIITTGDGGMLVTNSKKVYQKAVYYCDHAMYKSKPYWHNEIGYNYRMTSMQAAFGLAQLEKTKKILNRKNKIAQMYTRKLKTINDLFIPQLTTYGSSVSWLYTVYCKSLNQRKKLQIFLKTNNIDTRNVFYPITEMLPYKENQVYPVSRKLSQTGVSLPSSAGLEKEDIDYITGKVLEFYS